MSQSNQIDLREVSDEDFIHILANGLEGLKMKLWHANKLIPEEKQGIDFMTIPFTNSVLSEFRARFGNWKEIDFMISSVSKTIDRMTCEVCGRNIEHDGDKYQFFQCKDPECKVRCQSNSFCNFDCHANTSKMGMKSEHPVKDIRDLTNVQYSYIEVRENGDEVHHCLTLDQTDISLECRRHETEDRWDGDGWALRDGRNDPIIRIIGAKSCLFCESGLPY